MQIWATKGREALGRVTRREFFRQSILWGATLRLLEAAPAAGAEAASPAAGALSPNQQGVLDSVAEAVVQVEPGAYAVAEARVGAFASSYLAGLPGPIRGLYRLLLLVFEVSPVFFGRFSRFSRLPVEARRAFLEGWMKSRLAFRRVAFNALKMFSVMGYYRHAETWKDLGYDGPTLDRIPLPTVPEDLRRFPKFHPLPGASGNVEEACDVVVVGSGAGGAVAAAELAKAGKEVVLLEMGAYHTSRDFTQREDEMMPELFQDRGARATDDMAITILQGKGIGGSTLHNTNLCYRVPDWVLEEWRAKSGVGWLDRKTLAPLYDEVERRISVTEVSPDAVNPNNEVTRRGATRLRWKVSLAHHNRVGCVGSGFCELGCAYDAKRNMALTYVPDALDHGARVYADARVDRIVVEGGKATGVRGHRSDGSRLAVRAKAVVVSAGAIDTPRLLLASGIQGTGRRVGTGLKLHPFVAVAGVFDDAIEGWHGIPQTVLMEEFLKPEVENPFLIIPGFAHPMGLAVQVPGLGATHREWMRLYPRVAALGAMIHDRTEGEVRGTARGLPDIRYRLEERDRRGLQAGMKAGAEILLAAGAKRVLLPHMDPIELRSKGDLGVVDEVGIVPGRTVVASVHPQASCSLGAAPARGVVNEEGEVWGTKNLFVADTSLYPGSLGGPPQVTAMVLATHVARGIAARL